MKIDFIYEVLHSNKKNTDYFVCRLALFEDGKVVKKSNPILWLTKEQYDRLTSSK